MLTLGRNEGQWVDVTHRSGDVMRIRVNGIYLDRFGKPKVDLGIDDQPRNFEIVRPEFIRPHQRA